MVLIPARLTRAQEAEWVTEMVARLERTERRRRPRGDVDLLARAKVLSDTWLEGRAEPVSVRWVTNQHSRWGSCTPADRTIRLSARLQAMPPWVVDYVLVHELSHLLARGHDATFWAWVSRYPQAEKAKGYLEGWSVGARLAPADDSDDVT